MPFSSYCNGSVIARVPDGHGVADLEPGFVEEVDQSSNGPSANYEATAGEQA
jgi:hypothetical protein